MEREREIPMAQRRRRATTPATKEAAWRPALTALLDAGGGVPLAGHLLDNLACGNLDLYVDHDAVPAQHQEKAYPEALMIFIREYGPVEDAGRHALGRMWRNTALYRWLADVPLQADESHGKVAELLRALQEYVTAKASES